MTLPQGRSFQPISALTIAEWNPRLITTDGFQKLLKSIRDDPSYLIERCPLVADGPKGKADGVVYAGNRRAQAVAHLFENGWEPPSDLQKQGWLQGTTPVSVQDIPLKLAKKRAVQDNTHEGEWQEQELAELVVEIESEGFDIGLLGLSESELEKLSDLVGINGESDATAPFSDFDEQPVENGYVPFKFGRVSGQVSERVYEQFARLYRDEQAGGNGATLDDVIRRWLDLDRSNGTVPPHEEMDAQPHGGALRRRRRDSA